ncbi:MAG: hypothetical protein JST85_19520 [Acidobacteria bacterium]|nr:hypothetical protein [Acidobacteriota bacterium]
MDCKFASKLLLFACLAAGSGGGVHSQSVEQARPLVIFSTPPVMVTARLNLADGSKSDVHGQATLTITRANEDDSVTGTLVYLLPDEVRQKIAQTSGQKLAEIPNRVTQKDLSAKFQRGTSCPSLKLQVSASEVAFGNAALLFDKVTVAIPETPAPINQLFCSWTRQINAKRKRLGIIAAVNRLITVEEDVENKPARP